jgi:hypothetical protein
VNKAEQQLKQFASNAQGAGTALTMGLTAPLVALAAGSAKAAISFESAFAGIRKTVNATEDEFKKMSKGILDMTRTMPVAAEELAKIGEVAGQLPFRVNPILDTIGKWADYAQGRNPYDEFRNRSVIEPSAFTAGGWAAAEDMARFTVSQFGVMGTLMMWAIGRPGDPRQQTTAQRVIGSIPGLERILRVSDRGLDEKAWEEVDLKDQESARFKLGLPQNARNATRERYRLQRLRAAAADKPEGKLPKHDEKRLNVLMGWYRDVYLPATRYMHEAQDRSNTPMSEKWRAWLERETDKRLK